MDKVKIIKKDDNQYLVKSKSMVRAVIKARTTKLGTKLSFYAAHKTVKFFEETGIVPEICEFKVSDFLKTMNVSKGVAYKRSTKNNIITTALRSEMNKVLTFQFSVPKNDEVLKKIEFDDSDYKTYNVFTETWTDDGKCYFKVNKDVFSNNFINLKGGDFIKIDLEIVSQHKNNYAVRFYDYFKSFLWKKGFIYNKTFQINNLKVLLGVETAQSYSKNIGSLKQRILDPAVKEINRNTDIVLSYELVKTRQNKITHITFYAKLKSGTSIKKSSNVILKIDSLENIKAKNDEEINNILEKIDDTNDIVWN